MSATGEIWQSGDVTLYCGDCRDMLPTLGTVDAVVTDPPYGLDISYANFDDSEAAVTALAATWLPQCIRIAPIVAFTPGKRNEWLYPRPSWVLGWASKSGQGGTPWGFPCYWPILVYGIDPYLALGLGRRPDTFFPTSLTYSKDCGHPCPKPLEVIEWLVERVDPIGSATILDPFMGSGTTGVACVRLGRKFIGIEIDPGYFDIAKKRIREAQTETALFEKPPTPKQRTLTEGC